jgi:hypothetical protein
MRLCRFTATSSAEVRIGLIVSSQTVIDLTDTSVVRMKAHIERPDLVDELARLSQTGLAQHPPTIAGTASRELDGGRGLNGV